MCPACGSDWCSGCECVKEPLIAKTIATLAHYGQGYSNGVELGPYIDHPAAVAASVPLELKPAAWLHDVLEDSPITVAHLSAAGIAQRTIDIVVIVTRLSTETYVEFITRIATSNNIGAITVKLADLRHNLRPSCPDRLATRYRPAVVQLEAALAALLPV